MTRFKKIFPKTKIPNSRCKPTAHRASRSLSHVRPKRRWQCRRRCPRRATSPRRQTKIGTIWNLTFSKASTRLFEYISILYFLFFPNATHKNSAIFLERVEAVNTRTQNGSFEAYTHFHVGLASHKKIRFLPYTMRNIIKNTKKSTG